MGGQDRAVGERRLVLAEQPLEPEQQREVRRQATDGTFAPASISASAASNARRRAVPGASTVAASSPSGRNGSRVNFEARSMSSRDGRGVAVVATGVVSAMTGV